MDIRMIVLILAFRYRTFTRVLLTPELPPLLLLMSLGGWLWFVVALKELGGN